MHSEILNCIKNIASYSTEGNLFIRQYVQKVLTENQQVFNKCLDQPDSQWLEQVRHIFLTIIKYYFQPYPTNTNSSIIQSQISEENSEIMHEDEPDSSDIISTNALASLFSPIMNYLKKFLRNICQKSSSINSISGRVC